MAGGCLFLQHIIFSLKEHGKAAVVVPTGFLTASERSNKIAYKLREHLVSNRMLRGVISMPPNIFANTGTNVSIIFIDKDNVDGNIVLMDGSKLGTKVKLDGKNQKTVLSHEEIDRIITAFRAEQRIDDFCAVVSYKDIEVKKYSISAGQYFDVKIDYVNMTSETFSSMMLELSERMDKLFDEGHQLEKQIKDQLGRIKYER